MSQRSWVLVESALQLGSLASGWLFLCLFVCFCFFPGFSAFLQEGSLA